MNFAELKNNFLNFNNLQQISQLFFVQEEKEFLIEFVTNKEIDKFLNAGNKNVDHMKKMIAYIQYEEDNRLYEALINRLLKIHEENANFIEIIVKTSDEAEKIRKTMNITTKDRNNLENRTMNKDILNCVKQIMCEMQTLCDEMEELQLVGEMKNLKKITDSLQAEANKSPVPCVRRKFTDKQEQPIPKPRAKSHLFTSDSVELAECLFDEGCSQDDMNNFNEALACCTKSLEMYQRLYVGDHESIAVCLYNIARIYLKPKQWDKALEYFVGSLEMHRRLCPSDNENLAKILNEIGLVHYNQNNFEEALNCFTQSLELLQSLFGNEHNKVAQCLFNIACVYQKYQKQESHLDEALDYFIKSQKMLCQLHPAGDHEDIARTLNAIGDVLFNQKNGNQALEYFLNSYEMYQRLHKDDHDDIALCLQNIAIVYEQQLQLGKSVDYFILCLEMRRRLYPGDCMVVADSLTNVAKSFAMLKDYGKASSYYTEAYQMYSKLLPPEDSTVKEAKSNDARVKKLMRLKKWIPWKS